MVFPNQRKRDHQHMGNCSSISIGDGCARIVTGPIHVMTEPHKLPFVTDVQCCVGTNRNTARAAMSSRMLMSPSRGKKKPFCLFCFDLTKALGRLIRELLFGFDENLNTETKVKVLCSAGVPVSVVHHVVQHTERFHSVHEPCDVEFSVRQVARNLHVDTWVQVRDFPGKVTSARGSRQGCKL